MKMKNLNEGKAIENPPCVFRKTLAYNDEAMLCSFELKKGARIPLHNHRATQIGYVISGKVQFTSEDDKTNFEASTGDSYVFDAYKTHGAIALEDTFYIEFFTPSRNEYKDF
ncbi:MAG: cupin domain-containing protein [Lentisphaeria bacterium]